MKDSKLETLVSISRFLLALICGSMMVSSLLWITGLSDIGIIWKYVVVIFWSLIGGVWLMRKLLKGI